LKKGVLNNQRYPRLNLEKVNKEYSDAEEKKHSKVNLRNKKHMENSPYNTSNGKKEGLKLPTIKGSTN